MTWTKGLDEIAALSEQIAFLTRVAIQANQPQTAGELAKLLDVARTISVHVTIVGKVESGAAKLAQQLAKSFGERLSTEVIEVTDYAGAGAERWEAARLSAAIVCVVPAAAPLFDDTQETLAREFGAIADKLFVAVVDQDGLAEATAPEVKEALHTEPDLSRATVSTDENLTAVLEPFLSVNYLAPLLLAMRSQIEPSLRRLEPVVNAFADFLAMDQAEFAHRLEFIQRDLESLERISKEAAKTLQTQGQAAMAGIANQVTNLSAGMHQKAVDMVMSAAVGHDVLSSQDSRTRFGRELTASARAAGYREFDARVQAIAMNLNSARSLLLSNMEQARDEAEAHVEELQQNLGPELYATLLRPPLDLPGDRPLDVALDPGNAFTATVAAFIQQVRQDIPEVPFSSGWASGRIESMFRGEMASNATLGWTLQSVDGPAAAQVAGIWEETAARECGLLIGRIDTLAGMVRTGIESLRLKGLRVPKGLDARAKISRAFRGYGVRLRQMRDSLVTSGPSPSG